MRTVTKALALVGVVLVCAALIGAVAPAVSITLATGGITVHVPTMGILSGCPGCMSPYGPGGGGPGLPD